MALNTNLIAYYTLADTSDATGNGYTLTNTGSVTFGTGFQGGDANFNASNWLKVSNGLGLTSGNNMSYNYWTYTTVTNGIGWQFDNQVNGGSRVIGWKQNGGNYGWQCWYDGNQGPTTGAVPSATWQMITLVKTAGTVEVFINAASQGTVTRSSSSGGTDCLVLGNADGGGGGYSGKLSNFGVWQRALSGSEITELYNSGSGRAYSYFTASGPANLKSYNTNLKANIKSLNTNLIANIKSLDTNV